MEICLDQSRKELNKILKRSFLEVMEVACSHKNWIVNGDFQARIAPWTGSQIERVKNPTDASDYSILMGGKIGNQQSTLIQYIDLQQPEYRCAYYLTFRIMNISPKGRPAQFYATVVYLDSRARLIRSTPLLIQPPKQNSFKAYFAIVPPPPRKTSKVKIVFLLVQGRLLIDSIRFASRDL